MNVYEIITVKILEALSNGVVPWRKPWKGTGAPKNLISKKAYRGVNVFLLMCQPFNSAWWVTFKQAKDLGGSVRKGEKGTPVVFWTRVPDKRDPEGKKQAFLLRYYTVFNVEQCDGIPVEATATAVEDREHPTCEQIVKGYDPNPCIKHGGDVACYSPRNDTVTMPPKKSFHTPEEYYSTLFHELGHSTGAVNRLNRKGIADFDGRRDHSYAFEELVAECSAAFLAGEAGIAPMTLENSAAYIAHWKKALTDEPRWLVMASAQASKACDLILGRVKATEGEEGSEEGEESQQAA
jgi:antirestriction protein ArdC